MPLPRPEPVRAPAPPPATRQEAVGFLAELAGTIARLVRLMDEETAHLAAGRVRDGLAREAEKTELAAGFLQGVQRARSHAVALARLAPAEVAALRDSHETFRSAVERNQAVLATARAVSEGLVKAVADEIAQGSRVGRYGAAPAKAGPARRPDAALSATSTTRHCTAPPPIDRPVDDPNPPDERRTSRCA